MNGALKKKIYMKNTDTILVIDDDVDCNLFLKKTLSHHGFRVLLATSGKEGFAILDKEPCKGIFLDIALPDINGVEIAQRLLSKERRHIFPLLESPAHP